MFEFVLYLFGYIGTKKRICIFYGLLFLVLILNEILPSDTFAIYKKYLDYITNSLFKLAFQRSCQRYDFTILALMANYIYQINPKAVGLIFIFLITIITIIMLQTDKLIAVAVAAPFIPYFGISIKFRSTLITAEIAIAITALFS